MGEDEGAHHPGGGAGDGEPAGGGSMQTIQPIHLIGFPEKAYNFFFFFYHPDRSEKQNSRRACLKGMFLW